MFRRKVLSSLKSLFLGCMSKPRFNESEPASLHEPNCQESFHEKSVRGEPTFENTVPKKSGRDERAILELGIKLGHLKKNLRLTNKLLQEHVDAREEARDTFNTYWALASSTWKRSALGQKFLVEWRTTHQYNDTELQLIGERIESLEFMILQTRARLSRLGVESTANATREVFDLGRPMGPFVYSQ